MSINNKYRILILADHAWRDVPGMALVKAQIEKSLAETPVEQSSSLLPRGTEVDVLICDIHLFDAISDRWHPHVVVIPHLHDKGRNAIVDRIRRRGGLCVVLPSEGRPNTEEAMHWATNDFSHELCDLFLCWSHEFASRLPLGVARSVTGCQRFDFYFPPANQLADDRQLVLSKYGLDATRPIITVASSFPYAKFAKSGIDFLIRDFENLGVNKGRVKDPQAWVKSEAEAFTRFQTWMRVLACEYPDYQIIVKPHPAEDVRDWIKLCGEIRVDLMLTDYIFNLFRVSTVHVARRDCMTIPEAWIANIPTVQCWLGNMENEGPGMEASKISWDTEVTVDTIDSFLNAILNVIDIETRDGVYESELSGNRKKKYLEKWLGPMPDSASRIATALLDLLASRQPKTFKEPDLNGMAEIYNIMVSHSNEHAVPKTDSIGQFAKAVRYEVVNDWTNRARALVK